MDISVSFYLSIWHMPTLPWLNTILLNVENETSNKNYLDTDVFGILGILAFVGTCAFLKFDKTSSGFAFN